MTAKKIVVTAGHNVYVNGIFDPGATSYPYVEAEITKETVSHLVVFLEKQGHEVLDATPYNQHFKTSKEHHELRCKEVDEFGADIYLDIHINAGGGAGTEVWVHNMNSKSVPYAENVLENITKEMDLPSRGVKANPSYWSVSLCKAPAMIIEGAFIDNKDDMAKLTPYKYAVAIAKAFGEVVEEETMYKVQVGAYRDKANAENMLERLALARFEGFIDEVVITPEEGGVELEYKGLIKNGSRGNNVKELQAALNSLGFDCGAADGIAGNNTIASIKAFQASQGLVMDGLAGQDTYKALNKALKTGFVGGYRKIRRFASDIHIYEAGDNFVDVDLGVKGRLERVTTIINNHLKAGKKVLAGVNCGFFNFSGSSEHLGMLIDEGLYYSPPSGSFIDFIYYKDGTTEIVNLDGYDAKTLVGFQRNAHWAIGTSYSLVQKGKINLENREKFAHARNREPRTLLGQKKDGEFVLVVADGRRSGSLGLTAQQSAEIMKELGCYNAVNLDGGGSSAMAVVRGNRAQLVNRPSGGSERAVGSVLLVLSK